MERLRIALILMVIATLSAFIITNDHYKNEPKVCDDGFELVFGGNERFEFKGDTINITNYKKSGLTFGESDTYMQEKPRIVHAKDANTGIYRTCPTILPRKDVSTGVNIKDGYFTIIENGKEIKRFKFDTIFIEKLKNIK